MKRAMQTIVYKVVFNKGLLKEVCVCVCARARARVCVFLHATVVMIKTSFSSQCKTKQTTTKKEGGGGGLLMKYPFRKLKNPAKENKLQGFIC